MSLTILKLTAGAIAVNTDDAAALDIPEDGFIVAVDWSIGNRGNSAGFVDDDQMTVELSFLSTNQILTNDARGSISIIQVSIGTLTTSGNTTVHANKFCAFPEPLDVSGGERLHLHVLEQSAGVLDAHCLVHLMTRRAAPRRSRRRR